MTSINGLLFGKGGHCLSVAERALPSFGDDPALALAEKKTVDGSHLQSGIGPEGERVVVRAARLRLSTDKKLVIESTSWVKAVAKQRL